MPLCLNESDRTVRTITAPTIEHSNAKRDWCWDREQRSPIRNSNSSEVTIIRHATSVIFHFSFRCWYFPRCPSLIKTLFDPISVNDSVVQILHKGKVFYKHYTKLEKTYWRCRQVNAPERCLARLCTDASIVVEINDHNHRWVRPSALGEQQLAQNKPKLEIQINSNIRENALNLLIRGVHANHSNWRQQKCDIQICVFSFQIQTQLRSSGWIKMTANSWCIVSMCSIGMWSAIIWPIGVVRNFPCADVRPASKPNSIRWCQCWMCSIIMKWSVHHVHTALSRKWNEKCNWKSPSETKYAKI